MSETEVENLKISSLGIANRVIEACLKKDILDLSNMKIQKLCYYTYALFYYKHNKVLFSPHHICFWKFGPVVTRVYDSLKHYKAETIKGYIEDSTEDDNYGDDNNKYQVVDINHDKEEYFDMIKATIDLVIQELGDRTALQLSKISHLENSAWYAITNDGTITHKHLNEESLFYLEKEINHLRKNLMIF